MDDKLKMNIRFICKQEAYVVYFYQYEIVTNLDFFRFAVPDVIYSLPIDIDGKLLNDTVNQLLTESRTEHTTPIEFDFIVEGELLRTTVIEHLQEKAISTESTVNIEYVQRTPPPEPEDSILHDDWISGIHTCDGKW